MYYHVRQLGHIVSRKRIQRLMRHMGIMAIYQKPNLSKPSIDHKIWFCRKFCRNKEIYGRTRGVLDYLFGRLGFENYICIQQKEICEALDLHKGHVSSAIKLLLKKGVILPGPKLGRSSSYRLNPTYGWKGKVTNLAKTRLELVHSREDLF